MAKIEGDDVIWDEVMLPTIRKGSVGAVRVVSDNDILDLYLAEIDELKKENKQLIIASEGEVEAYFIAHQAVELLHDVCTKASVNLSDIFPQVVALVGALRTYERERKHVTLP